MKFRAKREEGGDERGAAVKVRVKVKFRRKDE